MDRYVIKGRGKNRGKYLSYARMAGLPPEAGHAWIPEQRKAMRCEDPSYGGETYVKDLARKHNGYFVKLIAPRSITREVVRGLELFIAKHAAGAAAGLPCHWFDNNFHDAGEDFCWECATKVVDEKYKADPKRFEELYGECEDAEERYRAIDGGFGTDHDSPPFCDTCGAKLSGSLTEYGAAVEIAALTGDCAPTFDDVEGWAALDLAITNLADDDPRWRDVARVVEAARRQEANATAPGMTEARAELLSVFAARAAAGDSQS